MSTLFRHIFNGKLSWYWMCRCFLVARPQLCCCCCTADNSDRHAIRKLHPQNNTKSACRKYTPRNNSKRYNRFYIDLMWFGSTGRNNEIDGGRIFLGFLSTHRLIIRYKIYNRPHRPHQSRENSIGFAKIHQELLNIHSEKPVSGKQDIRQCGSPENWPIPGLFRLWGPGGCWPSLSIKMDSGGFRSTLMDSD